VPAVPERSTGKASAHRPRGGAAARRSGTEGGSLEVVTDGEPPAPPLGQHNDAVGNIGGRLRARREEMRLSLRQSARDLGISPSFLSQIENGKTQPSVGTLYAICTALNLSIDELFAADDSPSAGGSPAPTGRQSAVPPEAQRTASRAPAWAGSQVRQPRQGADGHAGTANPVVRPGMRAVLVLDSGVTWERLARMQEPGLDFMLVRYEPGGCSTVDGRLMRHMGTEYGLVLSGVLEVTLAFETYYLEPGDSIGFDSSTPHRLAAVGDEPVEAVWFVHGRNGAHDH
jgi:transcriptional regulator with XRE-family HTH domain/quercetin dioxygenase-like cupin family protein